MLAYYKYQWSLGDDIHRRDAFHRLQVCFLLNSFFAFNFRACRIFKRFLISLLTIIFSSKQDIAVNLTEQNIVQASAVMFMPNQPPDVSQTVGGVSLLARVHLKLGGWRWHLNPALEEDSVRGNLTVESHINVSVSELLGFINSVTLVL